MARIAERRKEDKISAIRISAKGNNRTGEYLGLEYFNFEGEEIVFRFELWFFAFRFSFLPGLNVSWLSEEA